ncbi:MAG: nuclear transport factor 2 family protein [Pseudomonadota bacterium]
MIVEPDKTLFDTVAVEDFRVLAPGGVLEGKEQAIRGLSTGDVAGIAFHGDIAVVTNRLDIVGPQGPTGCMVPSISRRVFPDEDGQWRLVSQSLTPCLLKAVEFGRF